MQFNLLNTLVILGSLQGFLLALVFITNKKFRKKSNLHLALLIFVLSLLNLVNALRETQWGKGVAILDFLPVYWFYLIPFTLYFFIHYLLHPDYQFNKRDYLFLLPVGIHFSFRLVLFFLFMTKYEWLMEHRQLIRVCGNYFEIGAMVFTLVVLVIDLRKLNNYQSHLVDNYADIESQSLNWVKYTMLASLVLWTLWAFPFLLDAPSRIWYYPLFLGQGLITYWLGYVMYAKRDLFETSEILSEKALHPPSETTTELSNRTDEHYEKLLRLIEEEKLFKNPELSMTLLAAKMQLSNGYLSQIINQKEGKNFFEFINTYRVEEVKKNLGDPAFDHFSILGIALEAGFKSKSTFNAVFKKMTGQTPSAYKRGLEE